MFSTDRRDRPGQPGLAALEALRARVEQVDLRVPVEIAVRSTWGNAHGLAMLRIRGMPAYTWDDSTYRLREELEVLLDGIARP